MAYDNILYKEENHIVTITLNRPEKHNCISHATRSFLDKNLKPEWPHHGL